MRAVCRAVTKDTASTDGFCIRAHFWALGRFLRPFLCPKN